MGTDDNAVDLVTSSGSTIEIGFVCSFATSVNVKADHLTVTAEKSTTDVVAAETEGSWDGTFCKFENKKNKNIQKFYFSSKTICNKRIFHRDF